MSTTSTPMEPLAEPVDEVQSVPEVPLAEPLAADASPNGSIFSNGVMHEPAATSTADYKPLDADAVVAESAPPRLVVIRGQKLQAEYLLYHGENYIGRTDEKPVDIDLEEQEAPDRVWSSRQHARIVIDENGITIEDLGSQNGTFVNRTRIYPGQLRPLVAGDVIQVGTVQLKVKTD